MKRHLPLALAATLTVFGMPALAQTQVTPPMARTASDTSEPLEPNNVSELEIEWNITDSCFDISMTAPTQGYYYDYDTWDNVFDNLTSIEKIEVLDITSGSTLLHTFTNPAPGEKLSYRETSLERGATYDFRVFVYANGEKSEGLAKYDVLAGAVPATVSNVKVESDKGQMPMTVTFTAPATYRNSEIPLPSLEKIVLTTKGGFWDTPEELASVDSPEPGKEYSLQVNKSGINGAATWALTAYNTDGPSDKTELQVFVGTDTPGMVSGLTAIEQADGNILLQWEAPETGANNGYFDPEGLTYSVMVKTPGTSSYSDNVTVLAERQTECSYLYECTATEPTKLRFAVKASAAAGAGPETNTGYMIAGPALPLPFQDTFNTKIDTYTWESDHLWGTSSTTTESYPPQWKVNSYLYVGNTQVKPEAGDGAFICIDFYSSTRPADFRITSSKIDVCSASSVELSYQFYAPDAKCGSTALTSEISFDNGATFQQLQRTLLNDVETKGWNKLSLPSTPVPAGAAAAILRFTANNDPLAMPVIIDNISLKAAEAVPDVYPASVTDFTATLNREKKCVEIELTAPTTTHPSLGDVNNEPLTTITCIKLLRQIGYGNDYEPIHIFEHPAPGETLTYEDTDIAQGGEYNYRALVYVGEHSDFGNYIDSPITIGQIPSEVTELTISSTQGNAPVTISFILPATDYTGETLEEVTQVTITRYNTDTFVWDEIARLTENLTPGEPQTYQDFNVANGEIYEYRVTVHGTAGNSYGVSGSVYIGADTPVEPANLVAAIDGDGHVTLTWDAPTAGQNNGYIDTEHLTYVVQRGNGYSDYDAVMLRSGVTATTFTDTTVFDDEEIVKYFVKAVSQGNSGYSAISNELLVGKPSTLPYVENFDKQVGDYIQAEHGSWRVTGSDGQPIWAFAEQAYFINEGIVTPVDKGNGLAYAYYGHYSTAERDDFLTSGNIDVEGEETLYLKFHVYGVPGYDHSLDVKLSFDGDDFTSLRKFDYSSDFSGEGWEKVTLPINVPANARKMQMQFHAHKGAYSCSVAIDNITVDDEYSGIGEVRDTRHGITVASANGTILVRGAAETEPVIISTITGQTVHTGTGDCTIAAAPGTYLVKAGSATAKLIVR